MLQFFLYIFRSSYNLINGVTAHFLNAAIRNEPVQNQGELNFFKTPYGSYS
jgi:hypothetical protein